ncbi:hypothetical protein JYT15_00365 [Acidimicrobium ferrooxidans]|nr:hypothetical protein [Acidimicrobium ferrooxidans]
MFEIEASEIQHLITTRDPDGSLLAALIEGLILATADYHQIGRSKLRIGAEHSRSDEGVDGRVCVPIPSRNDWFADPTVWQYKRGERPEKAVVEKELDHDNHDHLRDVLDQGYAYRWVLGIEKLQDYLMERYEKEGKELVKARHPNAPEDCFRVLDAPIIARWLSDYPMVAAREKFALLPQDRFRFPEQIISQHERDLAEYRLPSSWAEHDQSLAEFLSEGAQGRTNKIFVVRGQQAVGKSRFVIEALKRSNRSWVYTDVPDHALASADSFVKDNGVIIADEFPLSMRETLRERLGRNVQAVLIDVEEELWGGPGNQAFQAPSRAEVRLEEMSREELEEVLQANAPDLLASGVTLKDVYDLSGGYPRYALFIIEDPKGINTMEPGPYLIGRLGHETFGVLAVFSLASRIGKAGEVEELFSAFSKFDLPHGKVSRFLHQKGLLRNNALYHYVSPPRVQQVAMLYAWNQFLDSDGQWFFKMLTEGAFSTNLQASIHQQFKSAHHSEIRKAYTAYFLTWARSLGLEGLAQSERTTEQFIGLLEASPALLLPILANWLESGSEEDILLLGTLHDSGGWSPRRLLLFSLHRLAAYPSNFPAVESVLLHLALVETETVSNNATGLWKSYFSASLAGTAFPFEERLELLKLRLHDERPEVAELALDALVEGAERRVSMSLVTGAVGGRPIPPDDNPILVRDHQNRMRELWQALADVCKDENYSHRPAAKQRLLKKFTRAAYRLGLAELKAAMQTESSETRSQLSRELSSFERALGSARMPDDVKQTQMEFLSQWRESLWQENPFGDIIKILSERSQWLDSDEDKHWQEEFFREWDALDTADQLRALDEVTRLCEEGGLTVWRIRDMGRVLGERAGRDARPSDPVFTVLLNSGFSNSTLTQMLHGWLQGHLSSRDAKGFSASIQKQVGSAVDRALVDQPNEQLDALLGILADFGPELGGLSRILDLMQSGHVNWIVTRQIQYRRAVRDAEIDDIERLVGYVALQVESSRTGETSERSRAAGCAIDLLASLQPRRRTKDSGEQDRVAEWWEHFPNIAAVKSIVEFAAVADLGDNSYYHLEQVLTGMLSSEDAWVFRVILTVLDSDGLGAVRFADGFLAAHFLPHSGEIIMSEVGQRLLNPHARWRLRSNQLASISNMPIDVMMAWLAETDLDGARAVAPHLPRPELPPTDEQGEMLLEGLFEQITDEVMAKFGHDSEVVRQFCLGPSMSGGIVPDAEEFGRRISLWNELAKGTSMWRREWAEWQRDAEASEARRWATIDAERDQDPGRV